MKKEEIEKIRNADKKKQLKFQKVPMKNAFKKRKKREKLKPGEKN